MVVRAWRTRHHVVRANTPFRDQPAEEPSNCRERDALDEKLPHDSPSACTKTDPNGYLLRPSQLASQKQIREIRTGDQQHEAHGNPHGRVESNGIRADPELMEILDGGDHAS